MPQSEVVRIVGSPRSILKCAEPFTPWKRPDCAVAYLYPSWGAPFLPSMWVVWFNSAGVVIDKFRFVSW
jgi:hypothetical protein